VNSFGVVASSRRGPLNVPNILKVVIPSLQHQNNDVRQAATKIVLDVQRLSGLVTESMFADLQEKSK